MRFSFNSNKFKILITASILVLWGSASMQNHLAHAQNDQCYDPKTQQPIPCPSSGGDKDKKCKKNNTCPNQIVSTPTFTATATPTSTSTSTPTSTPKVINTDTPIPAPINLPRTPSTSEISIVLISFIVGGGLALLLILIGLWRWFRAPLELPAGGDGGLLGGQITYSTFEMMGEVQEDGSVTGEAGMYRSHELE